MRSFSSTLVQWLLLLGCASARDAYLTTYDIQPPSTPSSSSPTIDSRTGNSILARRLGLTESQKLGSIDDGALGQLNEHGGRSTWSLFGSAYSLFGARSGPASPDRLLVVVEGYDGSVPSVVEEFPVITISRPDTNLASSSYLGGSMSVNNGGESNCKGYKSLDSGVHVSFNMAKKPGVSCIDINTISNFLSGGKSDRDSAMTKLGELLNGNDARIYVKFDLTRMPQAAPNERDLIIANLRSIWSQHLQQAAKSGKVESSILLLPSERVPPSINLGRRDSDALEEEPLHQSTSVTSPHHSVAEHTTANSTVPLPPLGSFLPACFLTNDSCSHRTNGCSGHGACYAKASSCWVCKCGSMILYEDDDGKNRKSIQWGGSACERKDVSVPFFLFAGFGIFMTAVVVGGIGLLYSMGSEDLPSVIGAGVTGPRAQR